MFACKTTAKYPESNEEITNMLWTDSSEYFEKKVQKNYSMVNYETRFESNQPSHLGASMAVGRGALVTVGQIAFYEQVKQMLLATSYFQDNVVTHFSASFVAGNA